MDTVYRVRLSEDHIVTTALRHRQQVWWRRPLLAFQWTIILVNVVLLGGAIYVHSIAVGALSIFVFGWVLLDWPIDAWFIRRRFRKSPLLDKEVTFSLSSDGALISGPNQEVRNDWPAYTKARRFSDGLLLFQGPNVVAWLPDAAATENSTIASAQEFVRAHVKDYRDV